MARKNPRKKTANNDNEKGSTTNQGKENP